jgi:heme exporter protein B
VFKGIKNILLLNLKLEWQQRQSYFSILIYVLSTVYLTFLVFNGAMSLETWNSFFWVIFIFAAVQAAYRSFHHEAEQRFLLYFGMVSPQVLILGKILYNFIYLSLVGLFTTLLFIFFLGQSIHSAGAFFTLLLLAALGFSSILTFVAGISAKAGGNPALPTILSIPLLYPQILTLSRVSQRALTGFSWEVNAPLLLVLSMIALVCFLLSYLLFPYLWRD